MLRDILGFFLIENDFFFIKMYLLIWKYSKVILIFNKLCFFWKFYYYFKKLFIF